MRKITDGYNPATWVLDVTNGASERRLGVDYADAYESSDLYKCDSCLLSMAIMVFGFNLACLPDVYESSDLYKCNTHLVCFAGPPCRHPDKTNMRTAVRRCAHEGPLFSDRFFYKGDLPGLRGQGFGSCTLGQELHEPCGRRSRSTCSIRIRSTFGVICDPLRRSAQAHGGDWLSVLPPAAIHNVEQF